MWAGGMLPGCANPSKENVELAAAFTEKTISAPKPQCIVFVLQFACSCSGYTAVPSNICNSKPHSYYALCRSRRSIPNSTTRNVLLRDRDILNIAPIPSPIPRTLVRDNSLPVNCDVTPTFISSSRRSFCFVYYYFKLIHQNMHQLINRLGIEQRSYKSFAIPPWASIFVDVYPSFTPPGATTLSISYHVKTARRAPKNDAQNRQSHAN